ncbi:MAG TPA: O-antigen ligase family protein [Terracidiphilus sp.]|nr:O-antigen ligase family protein [Terracidiphilus sp.]
MSVEVTVAGESQISEVETSGLAFAVGFFFSLRLSIVLISVRLFGVEPSTGTALSLALEFLLFGIVCFATVGQNPRAFRSILRLPVVQWVLVFLAFSGCSLLWSQTVSIPNSTIYWLGIVVDVASVALLLSAGSGRDASISAMKGFIWSTCLLASIAWIMPAAPDLRLGDEQFFNTNEIANLCAFAIFFAQYRARCHQREGRLAKLFLVITLFRSLSKTTLLAFLIAESLVLILDKSLTRKIRILLITFAFLLVLVFAGLFEAYYDVYTTTGNQAETLTGRIAIWLYVVTATFDHPWTLWIGHGFDSWWKVVPPFGSGLFEARHAENDLLQQFYAYGVVGVVLLVGLYGSLYRQLRRLQQSPTKILLLCFLAFILVRGLAESDAFDLLLPLWSIVLIAVLAQFEGNLTQSNAAVSSPATSLSANPF